LALSEKAGIGAERIPDCLAGGYADSNLMKACWPRMVQRDFEVSLMMEVLHTFLVPLVRSDT